MSSVLLGTCVGDALGVAFEKQLSNFKPLIDWDGFTYLESKSHGLNPGQYSDDGQMSLIVAESLIKNNGYNPEYTACEYLKWFDFGSPRGFGKTTKFAIDNLRDGKKYYESGIVDSYGNGSAMRAGPFGVYFANDLQHLIESIKIDSAITHVSPDAEAGALAVGLAIYFCINNDHSNLIHKISKYLPDSKVKENLLALDAMLTSDITAEQAFSIFGTKADIRMTIPSVFYAFHKFPSFKEGVPAIIKAGGDTDTNAAILGGIYAARDGNKDINNYWVSNLENFKYINDLDSRLFNKEVYFFPRK